MMEKLIDIDGGKLWTFVSGNPGGKTLLLCSGGPGCCDYLSPVSQMLEDDFRVIRFEQRGCGRSLKDGNYDLQTAIEDIERIREFYGVSSWIVGGHSWGANLALVYALENSRYVDSVLYIAGTGIHNNRAWLDEFHDNRTKRGETLPDMAYEFNPEVNSMGNASLRAYGQAPEFYRKIADFAVPTLFAMAEDDIRPSWPAQQLCLLMKNGKYAVIPRAEHYIWLFNPGGLQAELLSFLGGSI